jgi:signal transduction histidine kinase/ActR/RegA family two-component response regulator
LLAPLQARRAQNLALTVMLAAIAGAVVIGVTRLFAGGLRRVAEAVEHYEPGKSLPELPDSPDEVGLLARTFRDMAAKISEQMHSLREARQRAEAAMRAREEFMATMSHEIRTPMNAVLGMAHLLESEVNRPQQAERLRTLKFAGRHLMALLNNLLDRDRIESGDIVFDRVDFDLRELLENLRLSLEPLVNRKELAFVLEAGPSLPLRVQGDAVRLYQVLNNLAHNAIKFTARGRIFVRVEVGHADEVRFEISDTGPGLPAPVLESLRTSSAPQATAGLSLRISQRLIELLGGQLAAASTPAGTTISFSLRLPAGSAPATCPAPEAPPDLSGYSALVVEDVPSNQLVLGALLEKTGMAIDFAATAAQAREKLPPNSYDLAFVDIQLPDADGADLAAVLLRLQPELRVIAVTAQVSPEVRAACEAGGVRAFVTKPIEPAELYEKLRRLTAPQVELIERTFDHDQGKVSEYW